MALLTLQKFSHFGCLLAGFVMEDSSLSANVRVRGATSVEDIERLSADLLKCVRNDQLVRAKLLIKNLSHEERMAVSRGTNEDDCSSLFIAAHLGRISFVNFLLEECYADIEQRGTYEVAEDRSRHQVTPLWCAAVADKLEVVRTLIRHGAEVNALSDTQSTPVRSACYMTNIDIVRCLVEHGADIHRPNINGGTCLINSVQSVELCQFLIDQGALVNAVDNSGNLALHYAIREGRFDAVRLLLKHGSDSSICNDFGDDALQSAALRGHTDILEYLIQALKPTAERRADAYSLIGANCVDEKHDADQALTFWIKSANIRMEELGDDQYEAVAVAPNLAYNSAVEAHTINDLAQIAGDVDAMYMQALVVRERILGPDHKDTIFGLMYRGAVYADLHAYQRCIDLWKYSFWLRRSAPRSSLLAHEYLFTLQALCKLFWEIYDEDVANIRFVDVSDVLEMTVDEIVETVSVSAANVCPTEQTILLQLSLHLIHLACRLLSTEAETTSICQLVCALIQTKFCTSDGRTLLHLAVDPTSSSVADELYSDLPNNTVVEMLLTAGADVNEVDSAGNTPLHAAVSNRPDGRMGVWLELINLLLYHGAHVDMANAKRQIAANALPPTVNVLNHMSLKCLAAQAIRANQLPYRGIIPATLADFVDIH